MQTVERTELSSGLDISRLVTGMWQIADMERGGDAVDATPVVDAMNRYVDAGLTTFDMADHYGSSEILAGKLDQARPNTAQLLTKWVPTPGPVSRSDVKAAVERALMRMGRDQIHLLQFHAWNYADPSWLDSIYYLQELCDEGLIANLGLTNCDTAHLRLLLRSGVRIVSNQVCFSLLDQRANGPMTELCTAYDIKLLAFGTLAGGFLTERWVGAPEPEIDELPTWSQMKYKRFIDEAGGWALFQNLLQTVQQVAQRLGVSMANVATRAILESPAVGAVIVGARLGHRSHIDDNLRLFQFELDAEAQYALRRAMADLTAIPGDCGDEYRKPPYLTASGDLSHHLERFPPPYPTRKLNRNRTIALSGTVWEDIAGFARAIRQGDRIMVSGTTATHGKRLLGGNDPASQTVFCLDKIEGAIQALGGRIEDVVRTRVYVAQTDHWEPVSRAHGERFGSIRPANTLIRADLIGDGHLVEIEAEAIVSSD